MKVKEYLLDNFNVDSVAEFSYEYRADRSHTCYRVYSGCYKIDIDDDSRNKKLDVHVFKTYNIQSNQYIPCEDYYDIGYSYEDLDNLLSNYVSYRKQLRLF